MSQLTPGFYSLWLPRVTKFVTAAIFTIFHILTFENKTRDLQPIQGLCRVAVLEFTAFSVVCNHWVFFFTNLYKLFSTMESWTCNFLAWVGTTLAPSRGVPARHAGGSLITGFPFAFRGLRAGGRISTQNHRQR